MSSQATSSGGVSASARPSKSSKKVLIVDDSHEILVALSSLLRSEGYQVMSAADGEAAIRIASDEKADLIILDHLLPRRSGAEVARFLAFGRAQRPRIIMHSASSEQEVRRIYDGYDDFLRKPCNPDRLLSTVAALLGVERRAVPQDR